MKEKVTIPLDICIPDHCYDSGACKKYLNDEREAINDADKRFKELQERLLNGEGSTEEIQEYMRIAEDKYK